MHGHGHVDRCQQPDRVWKRALGGRRGDAPSRGRRGAGPRTLFERIMSHAPVAAYLYHLMKNETNCISWGLSDLTTKVTPPNVSNFRIYLCWSVWVRFEWST